jgi:hypothetical protein
VKIRTAMRLVALRWAVIFVVGMLLWEWAWWEARTPWPVTFAMGFCWGVGVGRMSVWDRERTIRKVLDKRIDEIEEKLR